jgi:hypothetical protein
MRWLFVLALGLFVAAAINYMLEGPSRGVLLGVAFVLPFLLVRLSFVVLRDRIDFRLEELLGESLGGLKVASHDFPDYRFVDVFRAVARRLGEARAEVLDSQHPQELGMIVAGSLIGGAGFAQEPRRVSHAVAPASEEFFPTDRFWIQRGEPSNRLGIIVRLRQVEYLGVARLEVAARRAVDAEAVVSAIRDASVSESIYRGQVVDVSVAAGVKDEFGNMDQSGRVKVEFRRMPPVGDDEIVLDPRVWPLIEHSLLKFHLNRTELKSHRVMLKRGFLFYGPPGTGKSFTCRYIASLLRGTTVVYCTGNALHHVGSAFNLARLLKPTLIVMEDVDLVFSSRDINAHGGALGDLFDQIDALNDDEPIALILTTNAIERLEAAVKDRPGRVSQCIHFGPPSAELRKRYILSFLKAHDTARLDIERLVRDTEGASQAFLKELAHRALQCAVEAGRADGSRATPMAADFATALDEIRAFDGKAARAITGFRVEAS